VLAPRLTELGLNGVFDEIEMPLIPVLSKMEKAGVRVDQGQLSRMSDDLSRRLEVLSERIIEAAGFNFNPNSPQQLGQVLFEKLNLPQGKKTKKKTGYSTDAEVLEALRPLHPLPGLVLDHRSLTKLKSTYVDALAGLIHPQTGRIHTHYNQTITATGRLSSSEPNLQNIPVRSEEGRLIRRAFVAPEGFLFVSADYSQIELRLLAHYAKDPALIEAFNRDEDIHTRTAAEIFGVMPGMVDAELRRQAKAINFGLIYGKTAYGLAKDLNISTGQAAKFIKAYFDRYTGVKRFQEETISQARKQGYVTTLWGRRRYLPELTSSNQMKRKMAERMAINMPLQGSAADLIKIAMIALDQAIKERGLEARLILQVHDELIVEVRAEEAEEAVALVRSAMEGAARLNVPLKVGVGQGANWDEAH
ncbi:MAG: DNA polymerase I, partial [Deltaproteobacteria bacterium]|nr:DNA polymerase I [Deltaproteobacteria bacterium]